MSGSEAGGKDQRLEETGLHGGLSVGWLSTVLYSRYRGPRIAKGACKKLRQSMTSVVEMHALS